MKKLLSILIAPLLAVTLFMGCTKVQHTSQTVSALYVSFMDGYISQGKNLIFKNNLYKNGTENNEGDYTLVEEVYVPTYEKVMYIGYNQTNLAQAVLATDSVTQASQLTTVYQGLLSLIFNYYSNWSSNFYTVINDTEITDEEWNQLYENLYSLTKTTETFVEKREELERDIRMNNNNLESQLVAQKMNAFNATYNDLILSSLTFVNNFKDLHKKYIFNNNDITPSSAKRWVDEAMLLLAEGIFYDNVLAFEKNNTVNLIGLQATLNTKDSDYIWFNKSAYYGLFTYSYGIYANSNINATVGDTTSTIAEMLVVLDNNNELKKEAVTRVEQLKTYVIAYAQSLKNYKTIFNSTNLDNYNHDRNLVTYANIDKFSVQEQSNINFLKSFSYNKTATMFSALYQVVLNRK